MAAASTSSRSRHDGHPDLAAAADAAAATVLIQTEQIIRPLLGGIYRTNIDGRIVDGTTIVKTRGANTHTG